MTIRSFVLDMSCIDGNLSCLLFWRSINIFIGHALGPTLFRKDLGNGLCQCRLSMIDMTNGSNVHVRLVSLETFTSRKGTSDNVQDAIMIVVVAGGVANDTSKEGRTKNV